jgi:hypothetical protein
MVNPANKATVADVDTVVPELRFALVNDKALAIVGQCGFFSEVHIQADGFIE